MKNGSRWIMALLGLGLLALPVGFFWDHPLPPGNLFTQVLADLFGEPVHLGPVLLGAYLVLGGLALAVKSGLGLTVFKYGLGVGLLALVIWQYWSYPGPEPEPPVLAATAVGLGAAPPGTGARLVDAALATRKIAEPVGLVTALGKPVRWGCFGLALSFCLTAVLITFVRWYVLVRAQDLPFTVTNALRLGMIGYYLSTFLPGSVGGDIFKAAFLAKEQKRRTVAVATVLIDRAIGLTGLFWLVALVGGFFWATGSLTDFAKRTDTLEFIIKVALGLVALSVAFWVLLGILPQRRADIFAGRLTRIPKVGGSLAEFWRAIWMYRCRGRSIALAMLLAVIGHVGFVMTFYFASRTLNPPQEIPTLRAHFLVVPVGMAIQAGCPTPSGVGGGEFGFGELYKRVGYPFDRGVLASLTQRVVTWILGLAGYLVYLLMRPSLPSERQLDPEAGPGIPEPSGNHVAADWPQRRNEPVPSPESPP